MIIDFMSNLDISSNLVREFYKNNWNRPVILSDEKFYNWLFRSNDDEDSCLVAYDDNKGCIAGVMGVNRREFYLDQKVYRAGELTTWVIDEAYRGSNIAVGIIHKLQENFDFLIGMGITDAALPIYLRSGFRYLKHIPRYIKVFKFETIKQYCQFTPLALKLIKNFSQIKHVPFDQGVVSKEIIDLAFKKQLKICNLYTRDAKSISWRYNNHPYFKYQCFAIKCQKEEDFSLVVIRIQDVNSSIKVLHIMDIVGSEENIPAIMTFIQEFSLDHDVDIVDFYCTNSNVGKYFLSMGWFSSVDDQYLKIPHLFSPIELREPSTTSLIYWSKNHMMEMSDISKLYITKQDADLDRPTLAFLGD